MKRTTYIILGILFAGLVIISLSLFYYSKQGYSWKDNLVKIHGAMKAASFSECKVVECYAKRIDDNRVGFGGCKLLVTPSGGLSGSVVYSNGWDKYLKLEEVGDTLKLLFDFSEYKMDSKNNPGQLNIVSDSITLNMPSGASTLINRIYTMNTTVTGFNCDTLSLSANSFLEMKESNVSSLSVAVSNLRLVSGKVEKLYVDLDRTRDWNVALGKFLIDTEYLASSKEYRDKISKKECRQVVWMPRTDDASLQLSIREPMKLSIGE